MIRCEFCFGCGLQVATTGVPSDCQTAFTNTYDHRYRCTTCQISFIVDHLDKWTDTVTAQTPPGFILKLTDGPSPVRLPQKTSEILRGVGYQPPNVQPVDWTELDKRIDATRVAPHDACTRPPVPTPKPAKAGWVAIVTVVAAVLVLFYCASQFGSWLRSVSG